MSEAQTGSGNPAPQQTAAPAPEQPQEQTQPAQPASTPQQAAAWHSKFKDETLGWLQNRGLTAKSADEALAALIDTARNAEKKLGVPADRLLKLPADPTEPGAFDEVFAKLGRPEKPDGYELVSADEEDDTVKEFAGKLSETFHKAGLSKDQGRAVFKMFEQYVTEKAAALEEAEKVKRQAEYEKLTREWGDTFDYNLNLAREAVKAAGATEEEFRAITAALGSDAAVLRFFNRIGQKRGGESPFIKGVNPVFANGATTPEAARARLAELKADPEWREKFYRNQHNPGSDFMKEYRALVSIAASGGN